MKLHIYHNNAYDTVALVKDGKVISHWDAMAPGGTGKTVFDDARRTTDVSDWDDQGLSIDLEEFETGNELYLVIDQNGDWDVPDYLMLAERIEFLVGEDHVETRALIAGLRA